MLTQVVMITTMILSFLDLLEQDLYAQVTILIKRTVQMVRYVADINQRAKAFMSMVVLELSVQKEKDLLQVIDALRVEHPMCQQDR